MAEGNVAEFLKFLPGITIDYTGGNARFISINGVPPDYTPVTVDGFGLAGTAGTRRAVGSDMISSNNLSRVEISYSPTPESQGSALAGSVNMVSRSAFERVSPVFNYSAFVTMRDNARDFHEVPGPKAKPTRNVHPGFDFIYVAPVSKRFGYTLSAGLSTNYSPQDNMQTVWRAVANSTNGTTFPHTTPDQPYLSSYRFGDNPKVTTRRSLGATVDFRITERDRVTLGFQYSSFDGQFAPHTLTFNPGSIPATGFTTTSTHGTPGAGDLTMSRQENNRFNRTYIPTLVWRHEGPVWKADAGVGFSQQSDRNRDIDKGYFRTATLRRTGATVSFDDIFYLRPSVITVQDGTTGAAIDPYVLSNYAVTQVTSAQDETKDLQRTAYGSLRREFLTRVPFSLKAGFSLREGKRDIRKDPQTFNYVGPDGRGSTTPVGSDDSAAQFLDPFLSQRVAPFGFPKFDAPSTRSIWEYYKANPTHFTTNENTTYRSAVTASKYAEELISAAYLQGDVSLLERRLRIVGGVRAEQANIDASGFLTDLSRNVQRDAQGQPILDANGSTLPITTDPLERSKLTYLDRGGRTKKEYLRVFPSINASYNIRENLIFRAAYYQSIGRPNFNQYAGGLTLPNTENPPSASNRISVNNAAIKPWTARSVNVRIERYFEGVGQVSLGAFRRDFENFFGGTVFSATPEFLSLYNLDAATYGSYDVATQHNIEDGVRMQGIDFSYRHVLTFLPHWARGIQVFANGSVQRNLGPASSNFAGFISRSGSWGISLTREKFNARVNWNYRGRQRLGEVGAGPSIEPGTFNWRSRQLYIDVLGEYSLHKWVSVFVNLRNIGDTTDDTEIEGPEHTSACTVPCEDRLRFAMDHRHQRHILTNSGSRDMLENLTG